MYEKGTESSGFPPYLQEQDELFVILIGKEQQFDLETKKVEGTNNLLSSSSRHKCETGSI